MPWLTPFMQYSRDEAIAAHIYLRCTYHQVVRRRVAYPLSL
jgi:hypothetical protein